MTSMLIQGAQRIFTGLPGEAMRASGAIRIRDGRISAVGALEPAPGERLIDASGCVVYPGLVSTHHHLFQCVLKGVRAGIDVSLLAWLRAVPYSYWHKIDEERCARPRGSDSWSCFSRGPQRPPITIIFMPKAIVSTRRM